MFFKKKKKENIKEFYEQELKRRDAQIDELKKQNEALLKTALTSSQKIEEIREKLEKCMKTNRKS